MTADQLAATSSRRIYTIEELNKAIQAALQSSFPGSIWVRGEVQRLPLDAARRKHVYFELHDTSGGGAANYQIPAALLDWDRQRFGLGRYLDGSDPDFQLRNELEVCLECRVDFYPPYGRLSLKIVGLDKSYTLGRLEALRREVLAFLEGTGLLEKNAQLPLPLLPLRVGLITAAGSAAERDFRSGLERSPYRFHVDLIDCRMQGEQTERQVVQALELLARRNVDVVVITRGGGSRGDLSWFDQKGIAVAIAQSPLPVITAIGHEIDRSIADVVAHQACKTPTAAAEFLVTRLDEAADRLADAVVRLLQVTASRLSDARTLLQEDAGRLEILVSRRVGRAREGLARQRVRLAAAAARLLAIAQAGHEHLARRLRQGAGRLAATARRLLKRLEPRLAPQRLLVALPHHGRRLDRFEASLGRLAPARLAVVRQRLDHLADRARLLDPERLLARGYTLTLSAAGQLLKSAAQIQPGELMRTRFHDGEVASIVSVATGGRKRSRSGDGRGGKKGGRRGGEEEEPGQKSLFW